MSPRRNPFFFLEKDLGFFYGAKLDTMGVVDNDRSKIKAIGKRKSKEIGLVEELLDSTVEVDENKGRKKGLEQEAVQESKAPRRRGRRRSGSRRGSRRSGIT